MSKVERQLKQALDLNDELIKANEKLAGHFDKLSELNQDLIEQNTALKQRIFELEGEKGIIPDRSKYENPYLN